MTPNQLLSGSFCLISLSTPPGRGAKLRTRKSQRKTRDANGVLLCEIMANLIGSSSAASQNLTTGCFAAGDLDPVFKPVQKFKKFMDQIGHEFGMRGARFMHTSNIPQWNMTEADFHMERTQGIWDLRQKWPAIIARSQQLLGTTFDPAFFPEEHELDEACKVETRLIMIDESTPLGTFGSIINSAVQSNVQDMTELLLDFSKVLEKRLVGERTAIHESTIRNILARAGKLRELQGQNLSESLKKVLALSDTMTQQTHTPDFEDKKSSLHSVAVMEVQRTVKAMVEELEGF